jgi:hypothetical protein
LIIRKINLVISRAQPEKSHKKEKSGDLSSRLSAGLEMTKQEWQAGDDNRVLGVGVSWLLQKIKQKHQKGSIMRLKLKF